MRGTLVSFMSLSLKKGCEGETVFQIPQELTKTFGPEVNFKGQAAAEPWL